MNRAEVAKLLTIIAKADNRSLDEPTVVLWQGILGDLPFDQCSRAVVEHYRNSTDWLMPAHIKRSVLAARQDAAMRELPDTVQHARAIASGEQSFAGLPIPGRPAWAQQVYEEAKARQREINAERKAQGLHPTYGEAIVSLSDRRPQGSTFGGGA